MTALLIIGTLGIILMSIAALLASVGDWRMHRHEEAVPAKPSRRSALTVLIYHTDIPSTLRSIAALHTLRSRRLHIIVIDNAKLGSHTYAFRKGLQRLYQQPIRLYARKQPGSRREALLAAYRYLPSHQQIIVVDGGDLIADTHLDQLPRRTLHRDSHATFFWYRQAPLGPSFSETAEVISYTARQFYLRMYYAFKAPSATALPAGSAYADRRDIKAAHQLMPLGLTPLPTSAAALPRSLVGQAVLLTVILSWIAIFGHVAFLAASFQTAQPLLLCGLLSLFAVSILVLWDQTTRLTDKLQLLAAAPLSALLIPVSLFCLICASIVQSLHWSPVRLWQLLPWTRGKHS